MHRASYWNVQINQQDAQILRNYLYFSLFGSTCFGTITCPSSGAPSSKLYHAFGTFVQASLAATLFYTTTQQLDFQYLKENRTAKMVPAGAGYGKLMWTYLAVAVSQLLVTALIMLKLHLLLSELVHGSVSDSVGRPYVVSLFN